MSTYRVSFLRRGGLLTVTFVNAQSALSAVDSARWRLTLGETVEVEAVEVEAHHLARSPEVLPPHVSVSELPDSGLQLIAERTSLEMEVRELREALHRAHTELLSAWNRIPSRGDTWIESAKTRTRTRLAVAAEAARAALGRSPVARSSAPLPDSGRPVAREGQTP